MMKVFIFATTFLMNAHISAGAIWSFGGCGRRVTNIVKLKKQNAYCKKHYLRILMF